ncbi:hypothetical protein DEO72_LG3g1351 [Vigna unguiculata]|uniref:Uncharacterized protein n=1 Tax=Vigna unguiculata TaxID=3917 RepID=A0A4D6LES1_VIGUN|nr:hypothetical protein DEO72_LG3g1351 [Vigna unguiculata]
MKHETHPSKLHSTATVANHHLNSNSLLPATMTPLPYGRHQECTLLPLAFITPTRSKLMETSSYLTNL